MLNFLCRLGSPIYDQNCIWVVWSGNWKTVSKLKVQSIQDVPTKGITLDLTACPFNCGFHSDEIEEIWEHANKVHPEETKKRMDKINEQLQKL